MNNSIFNGAREFYSFHTQAQLCANMEGEVFLLLLSMEILSEFGAHKIKLFSRVEFMNFNWSSLISQQMRQYEANEGWCVCGGILVKIVGQKKIKNIKKTTRC